MPYSGTKEYRQKHKERIKRDKAKWQALNNPTLTTINAILLAFGNSGEGLGLKMKEEK